ncbi:S-layer homology domain-containing protein [Paenibacillus campi]|uniref:S-layer homology domain-containing protein n=1 Tax=Paenibacillus campi TaxID=3106031 RepID=UPI002B000ED0|nr:S-layer homology domain-containing protein [Paenibacillus sp. SGZ-1009]
MAKRKKVRLAKWEKATKAISVSLTIMQLGNMSIPTVMNYAHAAEVLMDEQQNEERRDLNTVSDSVYAMAVQDTTAPTATFEKFQVMDTRLPSIVDHAPSMWGASTRPTLALSFNKKMKLGEQGEVRIYQFGNWEPEERLVIHNGQLSGASYVWSSGLLTGAMSGASTIQMMPTSTLDENKGYYVTVTSGAFVDSEGRGVDDFIYPSKWNFRTQDRTAPTMRFAYNEYSGGVLRFNEAVELKTGTLEVWDETTGAKVTTHIESVSGRMVTNNGELRFLSGQTNWDEQRGSRVYQLVIPNLQADHTYSVHISSGMFADISGNLYGGTSGKEWSFQVVDTRLPRIVDRAPMIWSAPTPTRSTLALSFNKKVTLGQQGEVQIYRFGEWRPQKRLIIHDGQLSGASYAWTSGLLSGPMSGASTIQMMPYATLDENRGYYVLVTSGAFVDSAGRSVEASMNPSNWMFHTQDHTAPTMRFDYNNDSKAVLRFNETVELKTGTLEVWDETTGAKVTTHIEAVSGRIVTSNGELYSLSGKWDWDDRGNRLYQLVMPNLQANHTYSVHISSGMFADISGNLYGGTSGKEWSFRVMDTRLPSIVDHAPVNWGAVLQPTLALSFNKKMKLGEQGEVRIYRFGYGEPQERLIIHEGQLSGASYAWTSGLLTGAMSGASTIQMMPYHALDQDTSYYVTVTSGAFVDSAGRGVNEFMEPYRWMFRTQDITAPTMTFDYSNYSGGVLSFNEPVELKTGTLEVWDETTGAKVTTHIEAVSGRIVTSNGELHSVNRPWELNERGRYLYQLTMPNLQADHTYSVHISSGMFADISGNLYGGTSGKDWSFHITDTGKVSRYWVSAEPSRTSIRPTLQFKFDKKMKLSQQGEIQIYERGQFVPTQRLVIHDGQLSGASYTWLNPEAVAAMSGMASVVEVVPQQALKYDTAYYVTFTSGAFVDNVGRGTAGLQVSDPYNWLFYTTFDMFAPTMTFDYSNYSGGFLRFSEKVGLNKGTLEVWDETNHSKVTTHIEASSGQIVAGNAQLREIGPLESGALWSNLYQLSIPNLEAGHTYSVHISSGMFVDEAGNRYEGTAEAGWSFHTAQSSTTETKTNNDKKTSSSTIVSGGGGSTTVPAVTPTPTTTSNSNLPSTSEPETTSGKNSSSSTAVTDKTQPPVNDAAVIVAPQLAPSGTVSLPAPAVPTDNMFVHYYDEKWGKWIAVPTSNDGVTVKANVPAGAWASVINSDRVVQPSDVVKSWAVAPVMKLMSLGIVQGDTQGNYNPKQAINRFEMAVILAKALRLNVEAPPSETVSTSSTNAPDWAQPYVQAILNQGIMSGNTSGFNGNDGVTREQLATMIGRMLPDSATADASATDAKFKDTAKMSDWAVKGINKVQSLGLMKGYADQSFRPKQAVTREEMAAVIAKVVDML